MASQRLLDLGQADVVDARRVAVAVRAVQVAVVGQADADRVAHSFANASHER